jgi:16S rRNA (guanine1207-N2)-methyltransferase
VSRQDGYAGGEQYFAPHPRARPDRRELRFLYRGELLSFAVDTGVFASHGLDPGTALLIEHLGLRPADRVLDLGCGWGAVGVAASRSARDGSVVLTDVNHRAVRLAEENLARNRATNATVRVGRLFEPVSGERFDVVATNPPYHAGRELVLELLTGAPEHLTPDGRLLVVGKGSQGIRFYQAWLAAHWAPRVAVLARASGYRVLEAVAPARDGRPPASALAEGVKNRRSLGGRPRGRAGAPGTERPAEASPAPAGRTTG